MPSMDGSGIATRASEAAGLPFSTAAQAIFGSAFRVTRERGKVLGSPLAARVMATVHPSSLLRQPDEKSRAREYALFVADLRVAAADAAGA